MGKRLTDLESALGRVPIEAMVEISKMADYFGKPEFTISMDSIEVTEVSALNPDIIAMKKAKEDSYLTLTYDMRVSRRREKRKSHCTNVLYFAGLNNKYYRVVMINSIEIDSRSNQYDDMMLSACYTYFKYAIDRISLRKYRSIANIIKLPETYADVNLKAKEFYDGYLEYRNSGLINKIGGHNDDKELKVI